jgi:hypothetical protein
VSSVVLEGVVKDVGDQGWVVGAHMDGLEVVFCTVGQFNVAFLVYIPVHLFIGTF